VHGSNIIDNGSYAFYTSACSDPQTIIDAENNWWGTSDPTAIEALIFHHADYASSPTVDYAPCADNPFPFDLHTDVFDAPEEIVPIGFALAQNFPNPFNSLTLIGFTLREPAQARIDVFDILGRPVAQLMAGQYSAGTHTVSFNGIDQYGQPLPSGVYLYRLSTDRIKEVRKMILLK